LAEGRPAVDNIQTYVWACHQLGFADPDLTLHASQVRDWYGTEDGLDLCALDADCVALESVVAATEDAAARQAEQLDTLSAVWQGAGAELSRSFLRRHGEASAAAAAAVRTAADSLTTLRDNLWRTVDGKVAAAIAADDGSPDDWLAAAQTVTSGAGDRAAASERVDQEVKPFVAKDIGGGWLTAMRSAMTAVMKLYDVATSELSAEPDAVFDVPGDLGPSWTPPPRDDQAATVPAAASAAPPVVASPSWAAPAPLISAPPPSSPMPAPAPPPPPLDATAPAMAAPPSAPSLGGMPDVGSGLSGFGQQLADAFGSLLGTADEGLAETPDLDEPALDDPELDEEVEDDTDDDDESLDPATNPEDEPVAGEPIESVCEPAEAPVEPPPPEELEPAPTPVPPPPEPALPPEPIAAETPCEIAADELPQVGE